MQDQIDPLERGVEARLARQQPDCCEQCGGLIPSAHQIKNPGTDLCDYCTIEVAGKAARGAHGPA